MTKECKNEKHWNKPRGYLYTCKKCNPTCEKQTKPLKSGNWCDCECGHNTLTCTICWKPVAMDGGMYWFVKETNI